MDCLDSSVSYLSWALVVGGVAYLLRQTRTHTPYGRYAPAEGRCCPARLAWFLQEAPAFLLPLLLLLLTEEPGGTRTGDKTGTGRVTGRTLLLCTFMLHYLHRSFVFSFLSRGRPVPLSIVFYAAIFCSLNGFLQGHFLLHCVHFEDTWWTDTHVAAGLILFLVGGMFEFVSGANFFGEILEWTGYALAAWSFPSTAFAFFTVCSIGPRAYQHHRDYQQRFEDYPRSRKALIPFLL